MESAARLFLLRRVPSLPLAPEVRATWLRSLELLASRRLVAVVGARHDAQLDECAVRLRCEARVAPAMDLLPDDCESHVAGLSGALGELAREFLGAEILILLEGGAIQLALSRALNAPDGSVFAPEPGQTIALDWPHPDAREFVHGLVGLGFDWDVGRVSKQALRFPGGASVLPRS